MISVAILLGWLAPSASALGLGIHLESAHSGAHAFEHRAELADLLRATTHGHHHDLESDRDHDHDVRFDGQAPVSRPDLEVITVLPAVSSSSTELAQVATLARILRRGPPRSLFTVHCVLLI